MKRLLIFFFIQLTGCTSPDQQSSEFTPDESVVLVRVSKQTSSQIDPWTKKKISTEHHLGTIVKAGNQSLYILVTAWATIQSTEISMIRYQDKTVTPLTIKKVDYNSNLAILTPADQTTLEGLRPVNIGPDIQTGSEISLFTDYDQVKVQSHKGTVSAVGVFEGTTSSYQIPNYLLKIDKTALGWSEPIFYKEQLIAISSGQGKEYIFALPSMLIRKFLHSDLDQKTTSFPTPGFTTQSLLSPELRDSLTGSSLRDGVRIAHVEANSPFSGLIYPNDILTKVGNHSVDKHQNYKHPVWGDIPWVIIYNQLSPGDSLNLEIYRNGQKKTVEALLNPYRANDHLIWQYNYKKSAPWMIYGGLIIQELSRDYLKSWGKLWQQEADPVFLYHWFYKNIIHMPNKRIVFISKILSDPVNSGYESFSNAIIERINDKSIHNLEDVRVALTHPVKKKGHSFSVFKLSEGKGEIILLHDNSLQSHNRIMERYNISQKHNFFN